jgi:predicted enzyme related to lactoylglutathione lyase
MDTRIELIHVPVADVDRAVAFYRQVGWNVDHDFTISDEVRFVQVTPPGSACSITVGKGLTELPPGSLDNLQAVVADADEALRDLTERGVAAEGVAEYPWGRFVSFADPDGNRWALQQIVAGEY